MEYLKEIIYQILYLNEQSRLFLLELLIISILGFSFQISFRFLNFEWVKSSYQILNFLLLAPIGFAITSVISSNIALSLGMVGALSIIRFRTPVKNSFELVVYFLLLTIGITASVEMMISVVLAIFVHLVIIAFSIVKYFNPRNQLFDASFSNDNNNFLTISTTEKIDIGNFELISLEYTSNSYEYVVTGNKEDLLMFQENLIEAKNEIIKKISTNFYT
ncbi:MAG: hypothetical protein CBD44_01120 [Flavobacteriaceae bacterium TMED184]|nr:MAG: hypothetical protein CBD44_01120 [Flavobacteriaceae bacterium TMED184]|tara:strand:+ start:361 stop:1017 length:657 start_codon:yes stop_codon:yes gene_type:complete